MNIAPCSRFVKGKLKATVTQNEEKARKRCGNSIVNLLTDAEAAAETSESDESGTNTNNCVSLFDWVITRITCQRRIRQNNRT